MDKLLVQWELVKVVFSLTGYWPHQRYVGSLISLGGGDAWYNVTIRNDTNYFKESDYYFSKLSEGAT